MGAGTEVDFKFGAIQPGRKSDPEPNEHPELLSRFLC